MSTIQEDKRGSLSMPQRSNPFERRKKAFENKPLSTDPHSRNPVYTFKTCLRCPFSDCDSRKSFSNAWKLWMHFKNHHYNEPSQLMKIRIIADAIIGEMR